MIKLPKYTLEFDEKRKRWELQNDKTDRILKKFKAKEQATKRDVLKRILGNNGGSVKIQKQNGRIQEERTYPSSRDPYPPKG